MGGANYGGGHFSFGFFLGPTRGAIFKGEKNFPAPQVPIMGRLKGGVGKTLLNTRIYYARCLYAR